MKAYLHDREGNVINEFGKTYGSNGFKGVCADLIEAKVTLWHRSEDWRNKSIMLAEIPIRAMNGHDLEISIK